MRNKLFTRQINKQNGISTINFGVNEIDNVISNSRDKDYKVEPFLQGHATSHQGFIVEKHCNFSRKCHKILR